MLKIVPEKQYDNFLNLPPEHSHPDRAKIVILSVPYERTVSYGHGAAKGPQAIIDASAQVEFYDPETRRELCFEHGLATLSYPRFPSTVELDLSLIQDRVIIQQQITELLTAGKFVVTLGGEHTVSVCSIPPQASRYSQPREFSVLQIDAHADLRAEYEGTPWSHACVMRRLCQDGVILPRQLVAVGLRAYCREEADFMLNTQPFPMHQIRAWQREGVGGWQQRVVDALQNNVYVTFDVDGLDPSIMPATGTPVPGGLLWDETLELFRLIKSSGRQVVGLDMVELAPHPAHPHCDFAVAQMIYKILNLVL